MRIYIDKHVIEFCFVVVEVTHRLKHRGPDWSGLHQHGDCFLAHQRLAIVDPASGDQPLFNEDKSVIVTVGHTLSNNTSTRYSLHLFHLPKSNLIYTILLHLTQVNGEIYNHEELRKQLPNHKFRTGSDCDVIAHLVSHLLSRFLHFN